MKNHSKYLLLVFLAFFLFSSAKAQNSNSINKITSTTSIPITKAVEQPIANSANKVTPLLIGATIPHVKLKNIEGKEFNSLDLVKNKPSVFIFYRGGW
jgi:ABC-type Zn uptake system ZnuABC Zn-binding protein ZnuA